MPKYILFFKQAFKNKISITLFVLLVVILGLGGIQYLISEEQNIPVTFIGARNSSLALTSQIVSIIGGSAQQITEISKADEAKSFDRALDLVYKNLELNREAREKATLLAKELEIMARDLALIQPLPAQRVAMNAISAEVALVSHFVSYNDSFNRLMEILRAHFLGEDSGSDALGVLAKSIGNEIEAINQLSAQFLQLINQLDGYFK